MLKKYLLTTVATLSFATIFTPVFAEPPAPVAPVVQQSVTPEEIAALQDLQQALAAATTTEERMQILANAIAATPTLASKPQLSSALQSTAIAMGLSIAQIDSAVITGLSNAQAPAAGGLPQSTTPRSFTTSTGSGGGSSTSTSTASQAKKDG